MGFNSGFKVLILVIVTQIGRNKTILPKIGQSEALYKKICILVTDI